MEDLIQFLAKYLFSPLGTVVTSIGKAIRFVFSQIIFLIIMTIMFAVSVIRSVFRVVDLVMYEIEKVVIVIALVVMTIAILFVAVDRWFEWVNLGWFWLTKLALFLMIWAGFIGASLATRKREHITIDVSSKVLSPKGVKIATFFSQAISAGFCFYMAKLAYLYTVESYGFGDREGVFPIPLWLVQMILPITLTMMGARFVQNIFKEPKEIEDLELDGLRPDPVTVKPGADSMAAKDVIMAGLFPGLVLGSLLAYQLSLSVGWLILINCIFLLFIGAPLFVLVGFACLFCVMLIGNGDPTNIPIDMFEAVKKETLLAIPFFMLAGGIMTAGTIATRLIDTAKSMIGHLPGGLAVSAVTACLLFAAISGSSPVTVIAIGTIMFPALLKEKYEEDFSLGLVTSAGTLGILIPPSIPMIIYAIMAPVDGRALSVRELFIAGVIPGFLVALILCIYSIFKQDLGSMKLNKFDFKKAVSATLDGAFALILIGLIFFGIYFGLFTAVEAAAVAVFYAVVVEFVLQPGMSYFRQAANSTKRSFASFLELKPREIPKVFVDSSSVMGALFVIIVIAIALNRFLLEEEIPQAAASWLSGKVSTKIGFLFLVNIFLLLLGCIMDIISAILIVAPLLAPIAIHYGVDPIHFGIIFIVNLQIGYITPPIGINLFVASGVFKKPIVQVIRATLPYAAILLLALLLVTYVPAFSLVLLGR